MRFPRFCGLGCDKEKTAMNRNRSGRRYDRESKNNAIALVRGERTITEVARDLGVSKWSLGRSVRPRARFPARSPMWESTMIS